VLAQALHHKWDQVLGDDEIARTVPEATGAKFTIKAVGQRQPFRAGQGRAIDHV
jgi:hypothetical protein